MQIGRLAACLAAALSLGAGPAGAEEPVRFSAPSLTPEAALSLAQATLERCRREGYQVTVAVVDRWALPLVLLRDRYAGPHTVEVALGKARAAVSFRTPTSTMAENTQPGRPENAIRQIPGFVMIGGGLPVEGAGSLLGGVGVSGAPGGQLDEDCAAAGLATIQERLDF